MFDSRDCNSVMASVQYITNEPLRQEIRGNASSDFSPFTTYELPQVWKPICKSGINVKIGNFNACRRDLGPFPSTVGGARDLTQQRKQIETSKSEYK